MANRTMKDLWNYMGQMINTKTVYANGKWGQFDSQGRQQFDCVCAIKAYGWGVPLGKDITSNQYTYIANNKATVPDESIASIYAKATKKSANMSTVPTDKPYLVYMDNAHIGVAYHGRVREMCGGSIMDARETDLKSQKWNKWSNLYWAEESVDVVTVDVAQVVGFLDVASYNNNILTCAGWAYCNGGSQKVTIKLYKNNAVVNSFIITANLSRTDVKNAMGYATDKVGYVLNQTLSLPDGTYEIKAYVGSSQLTNTKTFTVKNVATLTATSYPNYPTNGGQYYRVRKSFIDAKSSKGSYWQWKGAFERWNLWKSQGYHIYDNNGKQLDTETVKTSTTTSTQATQNIKPTLTNKSYPDYTGNKHYYVQKKFKSWLGSKGVFRSWVNAFNAWSKNKDKGYHIYDNDGRQLD